MLLAARQQTLVEIFKKQMDLVKAYVTMREKLSAQPSSRPRSTVGTRQPDHSTPASFSDSKRHICNQNSQKKMDQKPDDVLRPAADICKEHEEPAAAAASVTRRKNTLTRTDVLTEEANDLQGNSLKSGNTSTRISFRLKAGDALIQGSAEDSSGRLSELIERGLVSPGDVLQLRLKVRKGLLWRCVDVSDVALTAAFWFGPAESPAQGSRAGQWQDKGQ